MLKQRRGRKRKIFPGERATRALLGSHRTIPTAGGRRCVIKTAKVGAALDAKCLVAYFSSSSWFFFVLITHFILDVLYIGFQHIICGTCLLRRAQGLSMSTLCLHSSFNRSMKLCAWLAHDKCEGYLWQSV